MGYQAFWGMDFPAPNYANWSIFVLNPGGNVNLGVGFSLQQNTKPSMLPCVTPLVPRVVPLVPCVAPLVPRVVTLVPCALATSTRGR